MSDDLKDLIGKAKEVLDGNWLGGFTKPSPRLYPHQWNWDSGFVALGYARYDQMRAQQELTTLFHAQWANGMLPQIVFNPQSLGSYFPEPDFWQAHRSPHYPGSLLTSGITMPPIHATAARHVLEHAGDEEKALAWLRKLYPRLLASHQYLYEERDPFAEGLVYIRHPWESGLDNSPAWDRPLHQIEIDPARMPPYERTDLKKDIPRRQRPSDEEYDRYVYLVDLFRRLDYDEAAIFQESPFLVQDPLFNSILSRANEDLAELGERLGEDTAKVREWHEQTNRALREKLWHEEHGAFDVYDLRANVRLDILTASGFMPLFCGAPNRRQAARMYRFLESRSFCPMHDGNCFSIPNYNLDGEHFDNENYWRGPVWINTNWLLMHGLERYGFEAKTRSVANDILELVRRWGFHEYFDPHSGTGYGTDRFSWTAALFIDVALDAGTTVS